MRSRELITRYKDLIRVPWKEGGEDPEDGLDCRGVALLVLERAGIEVPYGAFPRAQDTHLELATWIAQQGIERDSYWTLVGRRADSAAEVGDVIYSCADGIHHHVSVLVTDRKPKLALTATIRYGVRAVQVRAIQGTLGVYRLRR